MGLHSTLKVGELGTHRSSRAEQTLRLGVALDRPLPLFMPSDDHSPVGRGELEA